LALTSLNTRTSTSPGTSRHCLSARPFLSTTSTHCIGFLSSSQQGDHMQLLPRLTHAGSVAHILRSFFTMQVSPSQQGVSLQSFPFLFQQSGRSWHCFVPILVSTHFRLPQQLTILQSSKSLMQLGSLRHCLTPLLLSRHFSPSQQSFSSQLIHAAWQTRSSMHTCLPPSSSVHVSSSQHPSFAQSPNSGAHCISNRERKLSEGTFFAR
jgi:hypothetical protein